jgi:predicted metal-binding membrane protein
MSVTAVRALHNSIRDKLRRFGWRYPEWWVVMAAVVAWMFMAGMSHPHASDTGITPTGGMSHAHTSHTHVSHTGIISGRGHGQGTLGTVAMVTAMVIGMMLPLTLTNVRHVAISSLWRRRHRAIAAFLVGFLAVWIVVQSAIVGTWGLLTPLIGWETAAGVAILAAALWEVAPIKRQRLRRCHRTMPLAPRGWRADADCARYGVTTGFSCVTMCWALMVAAAAFSHSFLAMCVLFGVQLSGRYQQRPSPGLASLAVLGVCLLSFAALLPHH